MSERSELFSLPIFRIAAPGSPKGLDPVALEQCSNPFFAYFLWRSKESERLPGRPRQTKVDRRKNNINNHERKVGTKPTRCKMYQYIHLNTKKR